MGCIKEEERGQTELGSAGSILVLGLGTVCYMICTNSLYTMTIATSRDADGFPSPSPSPSPQKHSHRTGLLYILFHLTIDYIILLDSPNSLPSRAHMRTPRNSHRPLRLAAMSPRLTWMLLLHAGMSAENPGSWRLLYHQSFHLYSSVYIEVLLYINLDVWHSSLPGRDAICGKVRFIPKTRRDEFTDSP